MSEDTEDTPQQPQQPLNQQQNQPQLAQQLHQTLEQRNQEPQEVPQAQQQQNQQPQNQQPINVTRQGRTIQIRFSEHLPQRQQNGAASPQANPNNNGAASISAAVAGARASIAAASPNAAQQQPAAAQQQLAAAQQQQHLQRVQTVNGTQQNITIIRDANGQPHAVQRGNRIRLPPGARQIIIPPGATGGNIVVQGTHLGPAVNNNNPNNVSRVPIPRLAAQPIPATHASLRDGGDDGDDDPDKEHEKYLCTICYEFLNDPSSCGNCASRFCHACLMRVAATRSASNPRTAKCPACRADLSVESIVKDEALKNELASANITLTCSFKGCNQKLASAAMKEHEQTCPFTPMRCKNSTMGCPWQGNRQHLEHHLKAHCPVERIGGVVHQFRQSRADHQAAIISLQQRQTMSNQMSEVNAGLMRRALPSPTNLWDILNLIYTATCTTAYFLYTADIWRLFLVQQGAREARGLVSNLVYMLPTTINVFRSAIGGYRSLLSLDFEQDIQLYAEQLAVGMLSMTPAIVLLTTATCFLLDGRSALQWTQHKLLRGRIERPILCDMATSGLLAINVVMIEADDAGVAAVFLWLTVLTATCFFPPILLTIIGSAGGIAEPTPMQVFDSGRSARIVLFTLQHGAMIGFLGLSPWIDAVLIFQLVCRALPIFVVKHNFQPLFPGIWDKLGTEYLTGFLAIRFSMWAIETKLEQIPWLTVITTLVYPLLNFLQYQLTFLGTKIGSLIFREGRVNVLPSQLGVRNAFSVYGTLSYCIWGTMLLMVAVTIG